MPAPFVEHIEGWIVARSGACLSLDRPVDKALSGDQMAALGRRLAVWARDPDLYAVHVGTSVLRLAPADLEPDSSAALAELIWRLECFSKPTVALADGVVGEVGFGFARAATHFAVSDGATLTMTALAEHRLPHGAVLAALAGLPTELADRIICDGMPVDGELAVRVGLASYCIPQAQFGAILAGLADADPVDPLLDARHQPVAVDGVCYGRPVPGRSGLALVALALLDAIRGQPLDAALSIAHGYSRAIEVLGVDASPVVVREKARTFRLELPSRRQLQDFRRLG